MATRTRKTPAAQLIGEPPDGKTKLLVKNLYPGGISLRPDSPNTDVNFRPRETILLDPSWRTNADLLKFLGMNYLSVKWVGDEVEVDAYPDLDKSPDEFRSLSSYERAVALTISQSADDVSLKLANITVNKPDTTEIDIAYMRNTLFKVYGLAMWCEQQLDARPKVLNRLKESLRAIQTL